MTPSVPVWIIMVATHPNGEFSRRRWFGWKRGVVTEMITKPRSGLELVASLCFLGFCRLVSEEPT